MEKDLTLRDFKFYCLGKNPNEIIYASKNQDVIGEPCSDRKFDITFQNISVYESPNQIYLKTKDAYMLLQGVNGVEMEKSVLGDVVKVRYGRGEGKKTCTLIMR